MKNMKKEIKASQAPKAVGPYSQAIQVGNLLFCSGQIGVDPKTNKIVAGGIKEQVTQSFKNVAAVLKNAGCDFDDVIKVNVYLQNMADFEAMNKIYASFFKEPFPARATVEVAKLPKGALIEIDCIAYLKNQEEGCCGEGGCGGCC